jgi:hypothetical protein
MMNVTEARVRPGESLAVFPITVPRPAGIGSVYQRCVGKPRHLSYTGTAIREIPYEVRFWVIQHNKTFPFVIKTDVVDSNKPPKLEKKLKDHLATMSDIFPLQEALPDMYYDEDNDELPHFVVELPPRTALYSSNMLFMLGLGFAKDNRLKEETREIGGRGKKKTTKQVYGFFNHGLKAQTYRGGVFHKGTPMNANVPKDIPMPDSMQVQVELNDWGRQPLPLLASERQRWPATKENAIRFLTLQLGRIVRVVNLKENPFDVVSGSGDVVQISNRASAGAGMSIQIELNEEMLSAYGLTQGHLMTFPLSQTRSYELLVRSRKDDPFRGLYPIVMRASGSGLPISYVEGLGHISLFAYINDKQPILTEGIRFETERNFLTIQFYDKNKQLVVFQDGHRIEMLMSFNFV